MENKLRKAAQILPWIMLPCVAAHAGGSFKENFLVGIDGGYAWRDATVNTETRDISNNVFYKYSREYDTDGGIFGIFGGFQIMCDRWLVGLEANFGWQGFDDQQDFAQVFGVNTVTGYVDFEREFVFGVSFRGGYELTNWMLAYVRLGVETSQDTLKGVVDIDGARAFDYDQKHRSVRYLVGAGVEFPIPSYENISLRVEYNYSQRDGSFGFANTVIGLAPASVYAELNPNQHAVKGAVVWNFI